MTDVQSIYHGFVSNRAHKGRRPDIVAEFPSEDVDIPYAIIPLLPSQCASLNAEAEYLGHFRPSAFAAFKELASRASRSGPVSVPADCTEEVIPNTLCVMPGNEWSFIKEGLQGCRITPHPQLRPQFIRWKYDFDPNSRADSSHLKASLPVLFGDYRFNTLSMADFQDKNGRRAFFGIVRRDRRNFFYLDGNAMQGSPKERLLLYKNLAGLCNQYDLPCIIGPESDVGSLLYAASPRKRNPVSGFIEANPYRKQTVV